MRKRVKSLTAIFVIAAMLLVLVPLNTGYAAAITKGPYLQDVRMNSAVIMWETTIDEPGAVEYGTSSGAYTETAAAEEYSYTYDVGVRYHYKATISSLPTNTTIYYRVKSGSAYTNESSFKTAVDANTDLRFLIWGDTQSHDLNRMFIDQYNALSKKPDFMLHVGDITQAEPEINKYWEDYYFTPYKDIISQVPVYTVMGNHDAINILDEIGGKDQEKPYENLFSNPTYNHPYPGHPEWNYSFTYGNVFVVGLFSDQKLLHGPSDPHEGYWGLITNSQRDWLNEVLKSPEALKAKWRIVMYHSYMWGVNVPFSSQRILPTLKTNNIDLLVNGHNHNYRLEDFKGVKRLITGLGYSATDPDPINSKSSYTIFDTDIANDKLIMNSYMIDPKVSPRAFKHEETYEFKNSYDTDTTRVALQQNVNGYFGSMDGQMPLNKPQNLDTTNFRMKIQGAGSDASIGTIKYDVSSIPSNAVIQSAVLRMVPIQTSSHGTNKVSAYKALKPSYQWGNGQKVPQAGSDYDAAALDTKSIKNYTNATAQDDWDVLDYNITSAVQDWIKNPSSNNGLLLKSSNTDATTFTSFATGDYTGQKSVRPALWVTYSIPDGETPAPIQTPIPTPTAAPTPVPTPKDTVAPRAPLVNSVDDNDTYVSGKAESLSTVFVKRNKALVASSKVKSDGSFSVPITPQKAGTVLSITARGAAGNFSKVAVLNVKDKTAPAIPLVGTITSRTGTVTGKAEAGARIYIWKGSTVLKWGSVKSDQSFSLAIEPQKKGTILYIATKDKAGNISARRKITVI